MLAIVEDQQQVPWLQVLGQRVRHIPRVNVVQTHRRGDRARDQRWVGEPGQFDQPASVDIAGDVIADKLLRQACLANAARTDKGEQRRCRQHVRELGELLLTADQARQRAWQVVLRSLEARFRGKRGRLDWRPSQHGPRASIALDQRLECLTLGAHQTKCLREPGDSIATWDVPTPALHLADAARADAGSFGQLLLRQVDGTSMVAQEIAKASGRFVYRHAAIVADRPREPSSLRILLAGLRVLPGWSRT